MIKNDYVLRISVTGNCNLNCFYCKREKNKAKTLSFKETIELIKAAVSVGIRKISWTGGEPTVVSWLPKAISEARKLGIKYQTMTTNGVLLPKLFWKLKKAGINRFNISVDSLDRKKYQEITGVDALSSVLEAIDLCAKKMKETKINCVIVKSNFNEIPNFIELCENYGGKLCVRFLELVPCGDAFGHNPKLFKKEFVSCKKVLKELSKYGELIPIKLEGFVPKSKYFKIKGLKGVYGVNPNASANYACDKKKCKKIRVSPNGFVSNCTIKLEYARKTFRKNLSDKKRILKELVKEKKERKYKGFKHRQKYYSFWRFGIISPEEKKLLRDK